MQDMNLLSCRLPRSYQLRSGGGRDDPQRCLRAVYSGCPLPVMAQAVMENALNPRVLDQLFEDVAEQQYTRKLLFSSVVDLMSVVVCRIQPVDQRRLSARTPRPSASRSRPSTTRSTASRPPIGAALVRTVGRAARPGHRGDGRRPDAVAAGLSHQDPRRQPPARDRAPDQGVADHAGRGLARPRPGRARPRADAGHRRRPLRGRPCPGAVAAGSGPGDRRGEGSLDRRPQLLHDRLPLRDRPAAAASS